MYWRIPSRHSACHVCHHIWKDRTQPFPFSSVAVGCAACLAGGWQGASRDPATADGARSVHPAEVPIPRGPHAQASSLYKYRAGQTIAELLLGSGLVFGTVLSSLPLLPMKPTRHPSARSRAWVTAEQMECFPVFLLLPSALAIKDCPSKSVWTLCHPGKANLWKRDVGPVHKSLLPCHLGSRIKEFREH